MRILRRHFSHLGQRLVSPLLLSLLACSVACSSNKDDSKPSGGGTGTGGMDGGTGTGGAAGASSASGGSTGSNTNPGNNACGLATSAPRPGGGGAEFEGCTGLSLEAEAVAADIFILLDQSSSMGDHHVVPSDPTSPTRWEAITEALKDFISAPETAGLRVGLQYFPHLTSTGATECDSEVYASPDVPIALVTEDHRTTLLESIDSHFPIGLTPAVPALAGALQYAKQWAEANTDRPTVLIWAADGFPTECEDTSITSLESLAEEYGNGTPRVATFVVGLGPVANLKRVADAGGTEAFFISSCETAVDDLKAALQRVASSPTLCEFELPEPPEGEFLDPQKVNLTFTPSSGGTEVVRRVDGAESCSSGGWYYDDPAAPTAIHVCPSTCGRFGNGRIDIVLGCATVSLQ